MSQTRNIILIQLGSPENPSPQAVRCYLKAFLSDPRIMDIPRLFRYLILHCFILPFRPRKVALAYKRIWDGRTFPLVKYTLSFAEKLQKFSPEDWKIYPCFQIGSPSLKDVLAQIEVDDRKHYPLVVIPQFPQYSTATTASIEDMLKEVTKDFPWIDTTIQLIPHFYSSPAFIQESTRQIQNHCLALGEEAIEPDTIILSFHGLPKRRVIQKNDPYWNHCVQTANLIAQRLPENLRSKLQVTFQSRFGTEEWLEPATDDWIVEAIQNGHKKFVVYCPSFTVDCLETLDEIGYELQKKARQLGANHFSLVPCLNDDESWARSFASYLETTRDTPPSQDEALPEVEDKLAVPAPAMRAAPFKKEDRVTLKIVLLSLFLDIIGFSIIFPMFPKLADYYVHLDPTDPCLRLVHFLCSKFGDLGGAADAFVPIVLFGGILGAIYSILQFLATPFWGSLSDRIGRKPVLMISIAGLTLSHLLWILSGNFTLLFISRMLGGIMGGKISTATAVIADITVPSNRSKGMALAGVTLGLGFVMGPALGGILAMVDITQYFPELSRVGFNPFSMPAVLAFSLSCYNLFLILRYFKESFPPERRNLKNKIKWGNPLVLFKRLPYPGVNLTNFAYFMFLMAYGGMEFTLTFLAVERLQYNPMQNAYMFIFAGFLIAMVQGGIVRRFAHQVGEKRMTIWGLWLLIPGFFIIGYSWNSLMLYLGLFLMSLGGGLTMPCFTSMVSLLTPSNEQGTVLGRFRSMGALARVFGPFAACFLYWNYSPTGAYVLGGLFLLIPIVLTSFVPKPEQALAPAP